MKTTRVLKKAPLYFVLAAVRFKLRESMPNWIGPIQEQLYSQFPLMRRIRHEPGGLGVAIDPPDFDSAHAGAAYLFSDAQRQTSVQIHKAGVVVFTRSYSDFDQFAEAIGSAVKAILQSAQFLEVESFGIRYVDFIRAVPGDKLEQYIDSRYLPYRPGWMEEGSEIQTGIVMNTYQVGEDRLVVRFVGRGFPAIPEDLALAYITSLDPATITQDTFPTIDLNQGTLDIDASRSGFSLKIEDEHLAVAELDRLHQLANGFFRKLCKDHAFMRWNEEG